MQVLVRDNNVDQGSQGAEEEDAARGHLPRDEAPAGTLREALRTKKAREKAEAIRRARKLARKRAQREGLLPGKPKTPMTGRPGAEWRRAVVARVAAAVASAAAPAAAGVSAAAVVAAASVVADRAEVAAA